MGAHGGHASESPPGFMCLFAPFLPAPSLSPSFDKHFLAAKSVPGLGSVQNPPPALEMLPAKPASGNVSGWTRDPG